MQIGSLTTLLHDHIYQHFDKWACTEPWTYPFSTSLVCILSVLTSVHRFLCPLPFNHWFHSKTVAYQELFSVVKLLVSLHEHSARLWWKCNRLGFTIKTKTLSLMHRFFGRFLCRHCMTSRVILDWNGNEIIAILIWIIEDHPFINSNCCNQHFVRKKNI